MRTSLLASERDLQSELDYASVARGKDSSERARIGSNVRLIEICMIECVEELGSELDEAAFIEVDVLGQREIRVQKPGSTHNPDAGIPKCLRSRTRQCERFGVEPVLDRPLQNRKVGISDEIWTRDAFTTQVKSCASGENWG